MASVSLHIWFDRLTSTKSDFIIRMISTVICFAVSLAICRKCMAFMSNIKRKLKMLLFWGMILPLFAFMQLKIEIQNQQYQRILKAQQEAREAKHDLNNRLAAYTVA